MGSILGVKGRYNRLQWWMTQLAILAILVVAGMALGMSVVIDPSSGEIERLSGSAIISLVVVYLIMVWLNISAGIKRYHDRGKSGWWSMIVFVPLIGAIWQLVELGFLSGDDGYNQYDTDDRFEQFSPYAERQPQQNAYVEPTLAPRRPEAPAAQRPSYGQKPSFGRRN